MNLLSVSLWLHLLAVVVWVGGAFFWTLVLFVQKTPPTPAGNGSRLAALARRVFVLGWEALGVLVLTGLLNLTLRVRTGDFFEPEFQRALGIKLVLVAGMALIQLWQHVRLLPRLDATGAETSSWGRCRRRFLATSTTVLALAAGALWFGIQLHYT